MDCPLGACWCMSPFNSASQLLQALSQAPQHIPAAPTLNNPLPFLSQRKAQVQPLQVSNCARPGCSPAAATPTTTGILLAALTSQRITHYDRRHLPSCLLLACLPQHTNNPQTNLLSLAAPCPTPVTTSTFSLSLCHPRPCPYPLPVPAPVPAPYSLTVLVITLSTLPSPAPSLALHLPCTCRCALIPPPLPLPLLPRHGGLECPGAYPCPLPYHTLLSSWPYPCPCPAPVPAAPPQRLVPAPAPIPHFLDPLIPNLYALSLHPSLTPTRAPALAPAAPPSMQAKLRWPTPSGQWTSWPAG